MFTSVLYFHREFDISLENLRLKCQVCKKLIVNSRETQIRLYLLLNSKLSVIIWMTWSSFFNFFFRFAFKNRFYLYIFRRRKNDFIHFTPENLEYDFLFNESTQLDKDLNENFIVLNWVAEHDTNEEWKNSEKKRKNTYTIINLKHRKLNWLLQFIRKCSCFHWIGWFANKNIYRLIVWDPNKKTQI